MKDNIGFLFLIIFLCGKRSVGRSGGQNKKNKREGKENRNIKYHFIYFPFFSSLFLFFYSTSTSSARPHATLARPNTIRNTLGLAWRPVFWIVFSLAGGSRETDRDIKKKRRKNKIYFISFYFLYPTVCFTYLLSVYYFLFLGRWPPSAEKEQEDKPREDRKRKR